MMIVQVNMRYAYVSHRVQRQCSCPTASLRGDPKVPRLVKLKLPDLLRFVAYTPKIMH